jgi:hypothetical protein
MARKCGINAQNMRNRWTELTNQTAIEYGTDKHNMWNKWPEYVQQTEGTCERND